jgi:amino acid permease
MLKLLAKLRIASLVALIMTSVPLVITYWTGTEHGNHLITHLHVYIGIIFILLAVVNMILMKKEKNASEKGMPL